MIAKLFGTSVPLLDRYGDHSGTAASGRAADASDLQCALRQDLVRLLNMRNRLSIEQFLGDAPTEYDYGLPDTLTLQAHSATDLQRLELVISRAIALYVPRLTRVRVRSSSAAQAPGAARFTLGALASLDRKLCQVHFELALEGHSASVQVRDMPVSD